MEKQPNSAMEMTSLRKRDEFQVLCFGESPTSESYRSFIIEDFKCSGLTEKDILRLGVKPTKKGYSIPYIDPLTDKPMLTQNGEPYIRERLRVPIVGKDGRPQKYTQPPGSGIHAYVLPETHQALTSKPECPLVLTEGEKKAARATIAGYPVVGLGGIWNWLEKGRSNVLNADLIPYVRYGRDVVLIYDSDATETSEKAKQFAECARRLAEALDPYGSTLYRVDLPVLDGSEKVGLDDYLQAGHDVEELQAYVQEHLEIVSPNKRPLPSIKNASTWIAEEYPEPDQILMDTFDRGMKVAVIGKAKAKKSFFLLQLAISLASGRDRFLNWCIPKARRVLVVQLELPELHYHQRLFCMTKSLGITNSQLTGLDVLNGRGNGGLLQIDEFMQAVINGNYDVVIVDPLYKVLEGDENAPKDMKPTLALFDKICEESGATVIFAHHDPKGEAGDRQTIDRGAGSSVLGRDFDAGIYISDHREKGLQVLESELRCYPAQEKFSVRWDEVGCLVTDDTTPILRTSANGRRKQTPAITQDQVLGILANGPMGKTALYEALRAFGSVRGGRVIVEKMLAEEILQLSPKTGKNGVTLVGIASQFVEKEVTNG